MISCLLNSDYTISSAVICNMCSDLMVRGVRFEAQAGQYNSQGTCPTTFISIVLTNHKIGRANGHAVLPFYLLNFNFFVTCNHNHACYYSGQGNFLITKGPNFGL